TRSAGAAGAARDVDISDCESAAVGSRVGGEHVHDAAAATQPARAPLDAARPAAPPPPPPPPLAAPRPADSARAAGRRDCADTHAVGVDDQLAAEAAVS